MKGRQKNGDRTVYSGFYRFGSGVPCGSGGVFFCGHGRSGKPDDCPDENDTASVFVRR